MNLLCSFICMLTNKIGTKSPSSYSDIDADDNLRFKFVYLLNHNWIQYLFHVNFLREWYAI